jgi:hypothetical protein
MFNRLPKDIIDQIFSYDSTFHEIFAEVLYHIQPDRKEILLKYLDEENISLYQFNNTPGVSIIDEDDLIDEDEDSPDYYVLTEREVLPFLMKQKSRLFRSIFYHNLSYDFLAKHMKIPLTEESFEELRRCASIQTRRARPRRLHRDFSETFFCLIKDAKILVKEIIKTQGVEFFFHTEIERNGRFGKMNISFNLSAPLYAYIFMNF